MDSVAHLLIQLYKLKATLWLEGGRLRYRAPAGAITAATKELLRSRKAEIISFLARSQSLPLIRDTISADLLCEQPRLLLLKDLRSQNGPYQVRIGGPYWEILRLQKPWELAEFSWDLRERSFVFHIAWRAAWLPRCPRCGSVMSMQSEDAPQCWKHSSKQVNILVWANVPRSQCTVHGTHALPTPWLTAEFRRWNDGGGAHNTSLVARLRQNLQGGIAERRHATMVRLLRPLGDIWRSHRATKALTKICSVPPSMVLPLETDPPFKTYQCFGAHPLSIVGAVTDLAPLLASFYINFSCNSTLADGTIGATIVPRQTIGHFVAAGQCELLEIENSSVFNFSESHKLIQLMIERIREGWYALLHVNNYYFPIHQAYMESDFLHDCLAFGFDTTRACFKVAMYLKSGQYGVADVSFSDMCKGLTIHGSDFFLGHLICYTPYALFVRPSRNLQFEFDRASACSHLANYLQSAAPDAVLYARDDIRYAGDWEMAFGYPTKRRLFGLEAFAGIACHIKALITSGSPVEMTATRALWEHKKIMHSNIRVWTTDADAAVKRMQLYAEVVDWARDLHLMCFVFNQSGREASRLIEHFDKFLSIIEAEKEVLTQSFADLCENY